MPLGIKLIAPISGQPAREWLNAPASVSLGTVAMVSGRRLSRPADDNDNDDGEGEEDTQGSEKGTRTGKGTKDGKGKGKATEDGNGQGKGKGRGNSKGKGNVKQIPGGDDISCAIALQLQKEMSEAEMDMEG